MPDNFRMSVPVKFTDELAMYLKDHTTKKLYITYIKSGCAGYELVVDLVSLGFTPSNTTKIFSEEKYLAQNILLPSPITALIDNSLLIHLLSNNLQVELDYLNTPLFKGINTHIESPESCGCGKSFRIAKVEQ